MKFNHQNFVIKPIFINDVAKEYFGLTDEDIKNADAAGMVVTKFIFIFNFILFLSFIIFIIYFFISRIHLTKKKK